MFHHYVMFKLKPECAADLAEVVAQLKGLEATVPAIRSSEVVVNELTAPNSFDVLFHIELDDERAFREDYMPHPGHVPVQKFIEARICGVADIDAAR